MRIAFAPANPGAVKSFTISFDKNGLSRIHFHDLITLYILDILTLLWLTIDGIEAI